MPALFDFDLDHTYEPSCSCDLCIATEGELHTFADICRDAWIEALDADLSLDQALPYEHAYEPEVVAC